MLSLRPEGIGAVRFVAEAVLHGGAVRANLYLALHDGHRAPHSRSPEANLFHISGLGKAFSTILDYYPESSNKYLKKSRTEWGRINLINLIDASSRLVLMHQFWRETNPSDVEETAVELERTGDVYIPRYVRTPRTEFEIPDLAEATAKEIIIASEALNFIARKTLKLTRA